MSQDPGAASRAPQKEAAEPFAGVMPTGLPLRALPLFIFLHVPKTAGTSARSVFVSMLGPWYFAFDAAKHRREPGEPAVWDEPGFFDNLLMVGGHIGRSHPLVRAARATGRRIVLLAALRDPVRRAVSFYDYVRNRRRHPMHEELISRTLAEVLRDTPPEPRAPWVNTQLMQVFGTVEPEGIDEALASENYVIGRQDAFEAFLDAAAATLHLPRPASVPYDNVAETRKPNAPVPAAQQPDFAEALERLAALNEAETRFLEQRVTPLLTSLSLLPPSGEPHPMERRPKRPTPEERAARQARAKARQARGEGPAQPGGPAQRPGPGPRAGGPRPGMGPGQRAGQVANRAGAPMQGKAGGQGRGPGGPQGANPGPGPRAGQTAAPVSAAPAVEGRPLGAESALPEASPRPGPVAQP